MATKSATTFIWDLLITAMIGAALMLLGLILIDPYDTGRLTLTRQPSMYVTGPRVSNASRMRDQSFDAAIMGNSTAQLLMPSRLNPQTGLRFVQLSTPGTGPREQKAMLDAYVRLRGHAIKAIVLGLDQSWCDPSREVKTANPFPFWLYDSSQIGYVSGLFRMDSLEALPRRLSLLINREKLAASDGYWNTEQDYEVSERRGPLPAAALEVMALAAPVEGRLAADVTLRETLRLLPARTRVVLVHPPLSIPAQDPGDAHRRRVEACKLALAQVTRERPLTLLIDRWVDSPANRDLKLFFDHSHYRMPLAIDVEIEISNALKAMTSQ
jgi:hypothetical protein